MTWFVAPLRNIDLSGLEGSGHEIVPGLVAHGDAAQAARFLPPEFAPLVGIVDVGAIRAADAVVLGHWPTLHFNDVKAAAGYVARLLQHIQTYLTGLWLVRDNCVMCDLGVLLYAGVERGAPGVHGIKHSLGQYFWNATAEHVRTVFSGEDLRSASQLTARGAAFFQPSDGPIAAHPTLPKGTKRLQRALYYLENARTCSDVGLRIAAYVSCWEVLFSTDSAELAHKLAERVALFMETTASGRTQMYQLVKRAYAVRSKIVHGDDLTKKQHKELLELSTLCDEVMRGLLKRVLSSNAAVEIFQSRPEDLEQFFPGKVLGNT